MFQTINLDAWLFNLRNYLLKYSTTKRAINLDLNFYIFYIKCRAGIYD